MAGEGASALRNLGGHCLHALLYLFGEVESVSATLGRGLREWRFDDGSRFTPQTVDTAFATLRFRDGRPAQINIGGSVAGAHGSPIADYGNHGRLPMDAHAGAPAAGSPLLLHSKADPRPALGQGTT